MFLGNIRGVLPKIQDKGVFRGQGIGNDMDVDGKFFDQGFIGKQMVLIKLKGHGILSRIRCLRDRDGKIKGVVFPFL